MSAVSKCHVQRRAPRCSSLVGLYAPSGRPVGYRMLDWFQWSEKIVADFATLGCVTLWIVTQLLLQRYPYNWVDYRQYWDTYGSFAKGALVCSWSQEHLCPLWELLLSVHAHRTSFSWLSCSKGSFYFKTHIPSCDWSQWKVPNGIIVLFMCMFNTSISINKLLTVRMIDKGWSYRWC